MYKSPGRKGRTRGLKGFFYLKETGNRSLGLRVQPKGRLNPLFRELEALLLAPLSRGVSISELLVTQVGMQEAASDI